MAQITIVVDTESKEITVNMDGMQIPNVSHVSIDSGKNYDDGEKEVYVYVCSNNVSENGVEYRTNYMSEASVKKDKVSKAVACVKDNTMSKVVSNTTLESTISNILRKNNRYTKNGV